MLRSLSIQNFALIEKAELNFADGFTAITGETGSGKSILLGALNLILGNRADYSVVRNPEQKTIVEAQFTISENWKNWFDLNEIDFEHETIIRREISSNGKSRAFINDSLVQLNQLSELTEELIYIHSQHETLAIRKSAFQFELIDSFGDSLPLADEVRKLVVELTNLKSLHKKLVENTAENTRELEFAQFQIAELEALELDKFVFIELEEELNRFGKLDELKAVFSNIVKGLETENATLDILRSIKNLVDKWKVSDPKLNELAQRIDTSFFELQDIASEAQTNLESLEMDPTRFEFLNHKIDKFNSCLKKNNASNQNELKQKLEELIKKTETLDASDDRINELVSQINQTENTARNLANDLFEKRRLAAVKLESHLLSLLKELKLQTAQISFVLSPLENLDANGGMTIQLLFSANEGMGLKPIEKAASGGELSRLMLAIQATMSVKKSLPTLILDEIDTGVSGEVALRIGQLLKQMGETIQVFAITHLPQVAAKGKTHLEVQKSSTNGKTTTQILLLSAEDRVNAIAKLMSGETITSVSQENAKQLLLA